MKRILVLLCAAVLLAASGLVAYRHYKGDRLLSVQTGSMVPTFSAGDAVVVRKVALNDLRVGDVVSYKSPADNRVVVSHRLISVDYKTGRLITKGDASKIQDLPIPAWLLMGRVYMVSPGLGTFLDWLHKPAGLVVLVYIPSALVLLYEFRRYSRPSSGQHYRSYNFR